MGITSLLLEQDRDAKHFNKDALESLGLVMASSRLLLNLINNLLDIKKATANSKFNRTVPIGSHERIFFKKLFLTYRLHLRPRFEYHSYFSNILQ